jgi:hypothetical protein
MDVSLLKSCLTNNNREELGIPIVNPSLAENLQAITSWAFEGLAEEGRQLWFCVINAAELRDTLPPNVRGRILPVNPTQMTLWLKRGPTDALLIPTHGFFYSDPNLTLQTFWLSRGCYKQCPEFIQEGWSLWFWTPNTPERRFFGLDHHHAVLWDAKQILRPLGIRLDFTWLCDGRPPINEAIPSSVPSFDSSLDIYKAPVNMQLNPALQALIQEKKYEGIITSHSLVTTYRLKDLGLPIYHINSTRFGNEWIQDPEKHTLLVKSIEDLLKKKQLRVFHNNRGDHRYFVQYFKEQRDQHTYTPSLCESILRLRSIASTTKFLVWDTRQVLLQDKSPFMTELFTKLKQTLGESIDSQAILLAESKSYLPEGYLDKYTAVIHLPYNVSTMSIFQQTRSNIPVWVPSKRLLAQLWSSKEEPNELSWTVFAPGTEANASILDNVRNPDIATAWASWADFYYPETMGCILEFDSIEELVQRISTTDYQSLMDTSEENQQAKREKIFEAWELGLKV